MRKKIVLGLLALVMFTTAVVFQMPAGTAYAEGAVYLGGTPLGITIKPKGVIVEEIITVITKEGVKNPAGNGGLQVGDLIVGIDGNKVKNASDIANNMPNESKNVKIGIVRTEKYEVLDIVPELDVVSGSYKIGVRVKEEIAGVGTLTFVTFGDNNRFGALGHMIFDGKSGIGEVNEGGCLYPCKILGVVKGTGGNPGELRGTFQRDDSQIGSVRLNNFTGIFGNAEAYVYDNRPLISLGSKAAVVPGKAYIYTTIEGDTPEKYEIEIVKAEKQNAPKDHSMVIHVTDEVLLEKTGGIVQGMSGSPIVQNGKLIGAVTHVFINDPTRGFGIYIDWMLDSIGKMEKGATASFLVGA